MNYSDETYLSTLKRYFGYDSFRSIQLDIIRSIGSGRNTLGLMPTGGGKSITFQVPALVMDGVCIVISPLIALMKDQVQHLKKRGIKAEAIYSGLSHKEVQRILDNTIFGAVKFLYISPERLSNKLFLAKLYYMKVCFIVVDEAHCISQWGHDFRPSYMQISKLLQILLDHADTQANKNNSDHFTIPPVLALTATATKQVIKDITRSLSIEPEDAEHWNVLSMSFRRKNLSYVVRNTEDKFRELMHIVNSVDGSVIVYTRNRERTKELSDMINAEGISATFYHAGLDFSIKERRQDQWQADEVRIMVATNAFGMGIDKTNVRLVIHMDCPDSIEAYFQEAGRAGRDGERAYAVLLCNGSDTSALTKRINTTFPPKEYIRQVYEHLAYYFELAINCGEGVRYEFNESEFCRRFKHYPTHLEHALAILQNAGYINYEHDHTDRARVIITTSRYELYDLNLSHTEEKIINALLRNYGTLFTDMTFIDFSLLCRKTALTTEAIHQDLKSLAQRRVIRYLPPRQIPIITYLRQRTDVEHIKIDHEIYEDARQRLKTHIDSMLQYINENDTCRERMLMEYFGEETKEDCGHCDVCLQDRN